MSQIVAQPVLPCLPLQPLVIGQLQPFNTALIYIGETEQRRGDAAGR